MRIDSPKIIGQGTQVTGSLRVSGSLTAAEVLQNYNATKSRFGL